MIHTIQTQTCCMCAFWRGIKLLPFSTLHVFRVPRMPQCDPLLWIGSPAAPNMMMKNRMPPSPTSTNYSHMISNFCVHFFITYHKNRINNQHITAASVLRRLSLGVKLKSSEPSCQCGFSMSFTRVSKGFQFKRTGFYRTVELFLYKRYVYIYINSTYYDLYISKRKLRNVFATCYPLYRISLSPFSFLSLRPHLVTVAQFMHQLKHLCFASRAKSLKLWIYV